MIDTIALLYCVFGVITAEGMVARFGRAQRNVEWLLVVAFWPLVAILIMLDQTDSWS